jgi:hypothetical protein
LRDGRLVAANEARSMILGAIALLVYAALLSWSLLRFRVGAFRVAFPALLLWLGVAAGLWYAILAV